MLGQKVTKNRAVPVSCYTGIFLSVIYKNCKEMQYLDYIFCGQQTKFPNNLKKCFTAIHDTKCLQISVDTYEILKEKENLITIRKGI